MTLWDALVVGGGPAGLAAGIHLARAGCRALLVEKDRLGGQASRLAAIENYPGFPRPVRGDVLMDRWIRQGRRWGLRFARAEVSRVRRGREGLEASLSDGRRLRARAVVAALGADFRRLGARGESRLLGRGIRHGAFEEAARFRGRNVAVAGAGEAAVHQAVLLARYARRVVLVCRGFRLKAHPLLLARLASRCNVELLPGARVTGVEGERALSAVRVRDTRTAAERLLPVEALFVLVGKTSRPYRLCEGRRLEGFFPAGDAAQRGPYRQVAIAAGSGVRAAMDCLAFLRDER